MGNVFVSGTVLHAGVGSAIHGATVVATADDGTATRQVGTAATDEHGGFGFELQPADHPADATLKLKVSHGGEAIAAADLPLRDLSDRGAHVDIAIHDPQQHPAPAVIWPFPIAFPGGIRPSNQQGPLPLTVVPRPANVPLHPMVALPYLIQHSYPNDPEEHHDARIPVTATIVHVRPPITGHEPP